jgi:fructokinase
MAEPRRVVAVELGGSKVWCAVGQGGALQQPVRFATTTPEETLARVEAFVASQGEIRAIGVASFGPLELDRTSPHFGSLLASPKAAWSHTPIAARLASTCGVPVAIDTDVNGAALAEQQLGAGERLSPCVYVTVGTGVGVGVATESGLLHGLLHPELGHLPAPSLCDFEGVCPFHGRCIEGVASAPALARRTGRRPEELPDEHPVWSLEARYLAHLLAAIVLAHAPRRIVLGGGVLARHGLLERVRHELVVLLAGYVPRPELSDSGVAAYVRPPALGEYAGLYGALLLAQPPGS